MKQLLFLLLFPCLALAQYQGNANQKITLGEQTTAEGLVFRGVASIDTVTATSKITRANKQDTSAYILLDTVTNLLWHYKIGSNAWTQAGGSTLDTATMLLPYYRAGRNTIIQAADVPTLNQNTTGSAATLTTGRTVQTNLASTSAATFNGSANITPGVTGVLPVTNGGTGASTLAAASIITGSGTTNYIPKFSATNTLTNSAIFEGTGYIQSTKRLELENTAYAIVAYSTPGNRQVSLGVYLGEPAIQAHLLGGINSRQLQINPEGGAVGIGLTNPTAALHLKAGTATASTAPLKFTSGVALTTPEVGAMEFSNISGTNRLLISPADNVRKEIAYTDFTNASGVLPVANGGTGQSTLAAAGINTGSGTLNYLPKYTAATTFGNSLIFDNGSNVGIGTTSPTEKLHVAGSAYFLNSGATELSIRTPNSTFNDSYLTFGTDVYNRAQIRVSGANASSGFMAFTTFDAGSGSERMRITSAGEVWIGYTADNGAYPLQVNGQIFATNATIATSDEKFKENITPLNKGLEIVNKLKPVTFNFISDTKNNFSEYEEVGFIAQDVDRALSTETFSKSIVKSADDSEPTSTMGLATQNLIPILVKAIQEQQALIKALEQRILNLENK